MTDFSNLCIHQATFMKAWDFRQCVEGLARRGIHSTAVWIEKLQQHSAAEARQILKDNDMTVAGVCPAGLVTQRDDTAFHKALDWNRAIIDLTAEIGCNCLVTLTGGMEDTDIAFARARARDGLEQLIPHARSAGVRLALEPLHPMVCGFRSVICSLKDANDWLDAIGEPDTLGIAFDLYSLWWEPDLADQLARTGNRLFAFHVADWLRDTKDIRLDRGMPGDGIIDIKSACKQIRDNGYTGPVEVEIFSEHNWWQRDPDEVITIIKQRYEEFSR